MLRIRDSSIYEISILRKILSIPVAKDFSLYFKNLAWIYFGNMENTSYTSKI